VQARAHRRAAAISRPRTACAADSAARAVAHRAAAAAAHLHRAPPARRHHRRPLLTGSPSPAAIFGILTSLLPGCECPVDEYSKKKFTKQLVKALKEEHDSTEQKEWAKKFDWLNIANEWEDKFNG
jgi:hypothetical protein